MSLDNPFFHRGAIRQAADFHGRYQITEQTLALLRKGQSISLIGPRRIGKSSLLLHLRRPAVRQAMQARIDDNSKTLFVMVDCQELGGSPAEDVYETLLTGLLDAAIDAGITVDETQNLGTYRGLDRTLRKLYHANTAVVILLDEFELLAANAHLTPYFFARLRGLTTKYGLAYLIASQGPIFSITAEEEILSSPFFNIFVTVPLGMFSINEARSLLSSRMEKTDYQFSPQLMDYLIYLVGPHPFFLQIAGYHAYQALENQTKLETAEDFRQLDAAIEMDIHSHLQYLWQNLSHKTRRALAVADGDVDSLRQLEQQCLLLLYGDTYRYSSETLRRFVRRQTIEGLIQAGPFVIDEKRYQVWAEQEEISLTTSQFRILVCLGQHGDKVARSEELETAVWGEALTNEPDRLKTLIKRLRRAVAPYDKWIVSERGVGYALREPG